MDAIIQHAKSFTAKPIPYTSIKGRVAYLIKDAISFASNNSAACRAHTVAKSLCQHNIDIFCMVQPGYPGEAGIAAGQLDYSTVKDGVNYIHLFWSNQQQPESEKHILEQTVSLLLETCKVYRPAKILVNADAHAVLAAWIVAKQLSIELLIETDELVDACQLDAAELIQISMSFAKESDNQDSEQIQESVNRWLQGLSPQTNTGLQAPISKSTDQIKGLDFSTPIRWFYRLGRITETLALINSLERVGVKPHPAKTQFKQIVEGQLHLNQGIDIPAKAKNTLQESRPNQLLYCLHQSVPYATNGYSTRSHGIAVGLKRAGCSVTAVTRIGFPWDNNNSNLDVERQESLLDGIYYIATPGSLLGKVPQDQYLMETAALFKKEALAEKAEVIIAASNYITALPALLAARQLGLPFVYEVRGLWEVTQGSVEPDFKGSERFKQMRMLEQLTAKEADLVITLTDELAQELVSRGVASDNILVIPNAVNSDDFQPKAVDSDLQQQLNLVPGVPVIGYAGSVVAYEGLTLLIEALAILKEKNIAFIFVLVGDGNVLEEVKQKAQDLGVAESCRFVGRVPFKEIPNYLSCMDILPIPRISSDVTEMVSALKPLEAMAMGKAVVLSDVAPHLTMAGSQSERARLFKKDSAESLADELLELINKPELRKSIGESAKEWALKERTWHAVTNRYFDAIESLKKRVIVESDQGYDSYLRRKFGINNDEKIIGYNSNFSNNEGFDVLLEACYSLVKKGEKLKLFILDSGLTLQDHLFKKLNETDIYDLPWVIKIGRVPDEQVKDHYALIDVIVIPSNKNVINDSVVSTKMTMALAYSKKLLLSDIQELKEYASKYAHVSTFEADNAYSLAQNLKDQLKEPEPKKNKLINPENINSLIKCIDAIYRNKKIKFEPIKEIELNCLKEKKQKGISYYEFNAVGKSLVICFKAVSKEEYAHEKIIYGVELQDSYGVSIKSDSYRILGYKPSEHYYRYKYLSANSLGVTYKFIIDIPDNASKCIIRLGKRHGTTIDIGEDINAVFYDNSDSIVKIISDLLINIACPDDVEILFDFLKIDILSLVGLVKYISIIPQVENFTADIYWYLWKKTNDPFMFEMARQRLVFQGRMYDLKKMLDEWDRISNYKNGRQSSRRIDDEINLLENGFPISKDICAPKYKPSNNVLYLLHNRLPYNSGGYATRTHGLLTGIQKNSNFKMHGVSRPGYPSDHGQHISKPLPKKIPECDMVDGIEYIALDQNIRRSNITTTEYIEAYAKEVEEVARKKKASIIHAAANFPNGLAASLAARRLGIKSVYEVRGLWEITRLSRQVGWDETDQFRFMAKMEAEACNSADSVITITEALKDLMVSRGVDATKITVAPNCVHTDLFSPLEKDQKLAKELGIGDEDTVIGYIGSIVNYEGLDDLLEALALLIQDGVTNFKFLLVGDGAVLDELKQQVFELGLQSYVVITGRVPHEEVQRYYSLVDITPFPRKPYLVCEAVSPLKPFEAMASQKAVIVSSCAALTEIIDDGYNGLVFEKGNVLSFKEVIKQLIVDNSLRQKLSKNGRDWVVRERDWSKSSEILKKVYDSLLVYI